MKKIVFAFVLSALLYGDEIERINALVKEIENLRINYDRCQQQLVTCESQTNLSKENLQLQECESSLHKLSRSSQDKIQKLQKEIKYLKNKIKKQKNSLKIKSKEIARLQKELKNSKKKCKRNLKNQISKKTYKKLASKEKRDVCDQPTVIVQEKQKRMQIALDDQGRVVIKESYTITTTRPKTFRTLREAVIYNKPGGVQIDKWEKGRSFTSYIESGNWIKITGYFVNKKWTKAQKEMWIKKSDAFERE